jgi:DNA-directed RNA polymerase subunit RPC12/RpoP
VLIKPPDICNHNIEGGTLEFGGKADGIADVLYVWQCVVCEELFERQYFKKISCPQHMWEFLHWEFSDNRVRYELNQVYACFNCGVEYKEPMDVRSKGMKGGVPDGIEHPEVQRALLINEDVHKRIIQDG